MTRTLQIKTASAWKQSSNQSWACRISLTHEMAVNGQIDENGTPQFTPYILVDSRTMGPGTDPENNLVSAMMSAEAAMKKYLNEHNSGIVFEVETIK